MHCRAAKASWSTTLVQQRKWEKGISVIWSMSEYARLVLMHVLLTEVEMTMIPVCIEILWLRFCEVTGWSKVSKLRGIIAKRFLDLYSVSLKPNWMHCRQTKFSNKCRRTKTKVITLTNHNRNKQPKWTNQKSEQTQVINVTLGKTRASKFLIGWESGANFFNQSESEVNKTKANTAFLLTLIWKLLFSLFVGISIVPNNSRFLSAVFSLTCPLNMLFIIIRWALFVCCWVFLGGGSAAYLQYRVPRQWCFTSCYSITRHHSYSILDTDFVFNRHWQRIFNSKMFQP